MQRKRSHKADASIFTCPIIEQICDQLRIANSKGLRMGQLFENVRYAYQKKNKQFDMFYLDDEQFLNELKEHIKSGGSNTRI